MDRRSEIIDAALYVFSKKGYGMSLSELAKKVGIKKPSLYSHFESKDDILFNALAKEIEDYFNYYKSLIDKYQDCNCETKYKGLYNSIVDYFMNDEKLLVWRKISLIPNYQLRSSLREIIVKKETYCKERISSWFLECTKNGHFENLEVKGIIMLYFTMIQGVLERIQFSDDKSKAKEMADDIFETFFTAIRK